MDPIGGAVGAFLLAFPTLFSIVNPLGAAFIFSSVTAAFTHEERMRLAGRVALYSLLVMLVALWGGSYVLNFFGVGLGALRIAGGLVVAFRSWELLMAPERHEARKTEQAGSSGRGVEDMAFFPLTLPFTTGPGTISVTIALASARPSSGVGVIAFFLGASAATLAIAGCVWAAYRSADYVSALIGNSARNTLTRLFAFLLLCVGVQIMVTGVENVVAGMIAHPG
jgi:multiple antibiotic resistance protein